MQDVFYLGKRCHKILTEIFKHGKIPKKGNVPKKRVNYV